MMQTTHSCRSVALAATRWYILSLVIIMKSPSSVPIAFSVPGMLTAEMILVVLMAILGLLVARSMQSNLRRHRSNHSRAGT